MSTVQRAEPLPGRAVDGPARQRDTQDEDKAESDQSESKSDNRMKTACGVSKQSREIGLE